MSWPRSNVDHMNFGLAHEMGSKGDGSRLIFRGYDIPLKQDPIELVFVHLHAWRPLVFWF